MPLLTFLETGDSFPPTQDALAYPNGLLAAGGDLNSDTLLAAYSRGIFPWYEAPQPVLWWSPDPRSVLLLDELHVSRSLRKFLQRSDLRLSADRAFAAVMRACAAPRAEQRGTWIDAEMLQAYQVLHEQGHAHSIEVWTPEGKLVGGLYGVAIGGAFFGESMFSAVSNASKLSLAALVVHLRARAFDFIDCQVESEHLNSLGARNMSRVDFEGRLKHTIERRVDESVWTLVDNPAAVAHALIRPQSDGSG